MQKEISVYNRNGELLNVFSIIFTERTTKHFKLDPETFYKRYTNHIPEKNIEMMIDEAAPFTIPSLIDTKTHIHQGNDGEYICYPNQINSMEEAIKIASDWCLITVFHIREKADICWFESFGDWMILVTKEGKEKPSPFHQFPLWIQNGFLGWKVEVSGK